MLETGGIAGNAGASWNMNGVGNPIDWSLGGTNTAANHLPQNGWIFGAQGIDVLDKEDWASADGWIFFQSDVLSSLDFGYRFATHERSNDFSLAQGPNWASNWTDINAYPAWRHPTQAILGVWRQRALGHLVLRPHSWRAQRPLRQPQQP